MRPLWGIIDFIRAARTRLRFGELSRAPLKPIRLQWEREVVECDWLARSPDVWDADISRKARDTQASVQALEDAFAVRDLLFRAFPEIPMADLRVYRQRPDGTLELILAGRVSRHDEPPAGVASLAMRVKLSGLHFRLEDGVLGALPEHAVAVPNS